ncbi:zinc-dependent metalloprotease [Marinoscillum sp.]|uniref:zinc-dependent metalloprotease n=1 Tax=Marinoscillum sp. TaxID=2024838 RepID=UPI003BA852F8
MHIKYLITVLALIFSQQLIGQNGDCSYDSFLKRYDLTDQEIANSSRSTFSHSQSFVYVIPTVVHVFHDSTFGKISIGQVKSGLKILNDDFAGRNDGWNTISPEFDSIKAIMNIQFVLATIDPDGNPTDGIVYHEDPDLVYNIEEKPFEYGWDNYKYFNIYLPKYVYDSGSNFSGYTSFPSQYVTNLGEDGIVLSSARWGFGEQSTLQAGDDWSSIVTHEAGHWLNLRHTFSGGCEEGDLVDDTPPTLGGTIELEGCFNNDYSCGVRTNGENFMDYNHRCKKMFTEGQVDRMLEALQGPTRFPLWQKENLEATGCLEFYVELAGEVATNHIDFYPNPSSQSVNFNSSQAGELFVFSLAGRKHYVCSISTGVSQIDVSQWPHGTYIIKFVVGDKVKTSKLKVH